MTWQVRVSCAIIFSEKKCGVPMSDAQIEGLNNASHERSRAWRIGVDIGGTFTDLVVSGAGGNVHVFKVPSVPSDPARGVMNALERAATGLSLTVKTLLADCAM